MSMPQGWSRTPGRSHSVGPISPPREGLPSVHKAPQETWVDGEIVEHHITLQSPDASEPMTPARSARDEIILASFWEAEAKLGFPVPEAIKAQQRRLMAAQGSVPTTGHVRRRKLVRTKK